ncbi:MAG: EAL domain-containing protein [Nitrospirae bacterium]|nr:EAL domain-containing protein [Nitrospirota bacterium]
MAIGRIILTLAAIIGVVESLIMLVLGMFPLVGHPFIEGMLDVGSLTLLSAPFVYLLVVRPVMRQRRREADTQEALNAILQLALQPGGMHVVLGRILDAVMAIPWLCVRPQGGVFLMDENGRMSLAVQRGLNEPMVRGCHDLSEKNCPMARAAQSRRSIFTSCGGALNDPCPGEGGMHGHMAMPIVGTTGETLGVIDIYLDNGHSPRPEVHFFLGRVARTMAELIERERIAKRIEYGDTLQAIMDHAPFGIWLTDADGRPQFVNETLCAEIGVPMERLLDARYIGDLFDEQVRGEFSVSLGRGLASDRQRTVYSTIDVPGEGERDFKITRVNIRGDKGEVDGFIGIVEDITETRRLNEQIAHQATHDALTGLLNRSAFEQKLDQVCGTIGPKATPHALCYIDLDEFKVVNDTCGHQAGDDLLRQVTTLYTKQLRRTEVVHTPDGDRLEPALARLGGDEFGLLLYNCPADQAETVARRLVDVTKRFRFAYMGQHFTIGCSIGVVEIDHQNDGVNGVLKQADAACYLAKEKGRGRVHRYQPDDQEILQRSGAMRWVPRIHDAIENDRFVLYFQAIAPLHGNEDGDRFEVLVRYHADAGDGDIPPGAFLPAAERYSLMPLVDRWIIDHTFLELARHYGPESGRRLVSASINLSGQTLGEEWLLEHICQHFAQGPIRPDQICFEITETAAIANLETAMSLIARLKDIGCRFSLDDFGSGLSSFSYLKEMHVDYLKIDGSLVKDIVTDPVGRVMVESINQIGHTMGIKTVAEWVENDAIRAVLHDLGVDFAQGYGIGMPAPFHALDPAPAPGG